MIVGLSINEKEASNTIAAREHYDLLQAMSKMTVLVSVSIISTYLLGIFLLSFYPALSFVIDSIINSLTVLLMHAYYDKYYFKLCCICDFVTKRLCIVCIEIKQQRTKSRTRTNTNTQSTIATTRTTTRTTGNGNDDNDDNDLTVDDTNFAIDIDSSYVRQTHLANPKGLRMMSTSKSSVSGSY